MNLPAKHYRRNLGTQTSLGWPFRNNGRGSKRKVIWVGPLHEDQLNASDIAGLITWKRTYANCNLIITYLTYFIVTRLDCNVDVNVQSECESQVSCNLWLSLVFYLYIYTYMCVCDTQIFSYVFHSPLHIHILTYTLVSRIQSKIVPLYWSWSM